MSCCSSMNAKSWRGKIIRQTILHSSRWVIATRVVSWQYGRLIVVCGEFLPYRCSIHFCLKHSNYSSLLLLFRCRRHRYQHFVGYCHYSADGKNAVTRLPLVWDYHTTITNSTLDWSIEVSACDHQPTRQAARRFCKHSYVRFPGTEQPTIHFGRKYLLRMLGNHSK